MPSGDNRKVIYDTNVYIRAMHLGPGSREYALLQNSLPSTYVSSVVSGELNVGAQDLAGVKLVWQFLSGTARVVQRRVDRHVRTPNRRLRLHPRQRGFRTSSPASPI